MAEFSIGKNVSNGIISYVDVKSIPDTNLDTTMRRKKRVGVVANS